MANTACAKLRTIVVQMMTEAGFDAGDVENMQIAPIDSLLSIKMTELVNYCITTIRERANIAGERAAQAALGTQ